MSRRPRVVQHVLCRARAARLSLTFASDTAMMNQARTETLWEHSDRPWLLERDDADVLSQQINFLRASARDSTKRRGG